MKKLFTTWLLLAIAVMGFQAKADLWLIGALSQYGWVPNQGEQFTLVSGNDYTLDLNVTSTGEKYFALTTQLASTADDWDAIKPYRFGGQGYTVTLGQDLTLVAGVDNSPKVTIPAVGVYTIKFNTSTGVINITRKEGDDTPEFVMPDFCTWQEGKNFVYIEDTNNWGASGINVYTWGGYDNGGWPGQANVNATPVGQYNGHNVYLFDAPTAAPTNLIISNNGNNRYTGADLTWKTGGYYNAGGMQGVVEQTTPTEPAWYIAGSFTDWANGKKEMTKGADGSFSITVEGIEDGAEFKFIDQDNKWYGGNTEGAEGNYGVHKDWCTDITLTQGDAGSNFQVTGQGDLTFTIKDGKLSITGWEEAPQPEAALYIAGSFTNWEEGKVAMTKGETAYTYTIEGAKEGDEFKFIDETNTWFGSEAEGENFWLNAEVSEANLVSPGKNFYINGAGDLVVTVDLEKKTVSVTGFEVAPEPEAALYIAGSFTNWEEGKVAMTKGETAYTYTIEGAKEGDEFKFIDETNTWFGSEAEGENFWLNAEVSEANLVSPGKNFYINGAGDLVVTVDLEKKTVKVTGFEVAPEPEKKLYVLGDFQEWKPNAGQELTYDENTKLFGGKVTLAEEGYIKFATKLQETEEWGDLDEYLIGAVSEGDFVMQEEYLGHKIDIVAKGQAIKLPAGEWTLSVDVENDSLVITGTWPVTPEPEVALYIAGSFTNWEEGKVAMTKGETAYTYTIEGAKEGDEFKFIDETNTWFGSEAEGENFWLNAEVSEANLVSPGKNFYINGAGDLVVTVDLEKKTVKVTGFEVAPEPEKKLYVLGDFQEWKPNAGQELTYDENTKLFGGKVTLAEEGYIKFATKLQETEEWGDLDEYLIGAVSEGDFVMQEEYLGHKIDIVAKGQAIKLPAGEWTLSVDVENDSLVITGTWPVTPEPEKKFYIAGSFTDPQWEEGKLEMTEGEDGAFSIEVKGVKAGDQFKFIDQDNVWYGGNTEGAEGNYGVHPEWCTDIELTAGDSGSNFEIVNDAKGDLTFTIKDGKLTITGWDETPVEPAKLYVLGDFQEWKPNAGQEMTYNEETKVYTVELTTEAEGCIKFTTQLSETEEWTIDEYLWGAESEGDFVLTDELVGQELTLKAKGEAFKIAAGKWAITADLENGKVIFAKAGDPVVRGDVNGDGVVSGADVTALYNNLLDETPVNGDPDVNGDGVVSGADVTALYGILMEAE